MRRPPLRAQTIGRFTPLSKDQSIAAGLKPLAVGWRIMLTTDTTMHPDPTHTTRATGQWTWGRVLGKRVGAINETRTSEAHPRHDPH